MQDVRSKTDRPSSSSVSPVITIRDPRTDGDRLFRIDRPSHAAVAPACLKSPRPEGLIKRIAYYFSFQQNTPDEHLATQEIAAIRLRLKAEHELKEKLTHLGIQSRVGTWVTHEEIDALETRQRSLVAVIARLRRERALMSLIALLIATVGLVAHLGYQENMVKEQQGDLVVSPEPDAQTAVTSTNNWLSDTEVVDDYDTFASAIIEPTDHIEQTPPLMMTVSRDYTPADFETLSTELTTYAKALQSVAPLYRPEQDILNTARVWLRAWSDQDVQAYLAHYATDFVPPRGLKRGPWEEERRTRILRPKSIEASMRDAEVILVSPSEAKLRFTQEYRSNTYHDETRKEVEWTYAGDRWMIRAEKSLP